MALTQASDSKSRFSGLVPFDEKRNQDRNKFISWLEDPLLLQNGTESMEALRLGRRLIKGRQRSNDQGVIASIGIFEWSFQTGSVCVQLTRHALATLVETLTDGTLATPQNTRFAWGGAPEQTFEAVLYKTSADMQKVDGVIDHKIQCTLEEFDSVLAGLPLQQDQNSKNEVAALRMKIEGKLGKMRIAEQLTGKRNALVFDNLVRAGRWKIRQAGLLKAVKELEVPDQFLLAIGFLSAEEIDGPLDVLTLQICNLVHDGEIDEDVAEGIVRLSVEDRVLLGLLGRRAGSPLSIKRPKLARKRASDYLPEPLGFTINTTLALNWALQEKMSPDVKLVMLCLSAIGETGNELRVATGLPFRRWQNACKRIGETNYLVRLESVAGNKGSDR